MPESKPETTTPNEDYILLVTRIPDCSLWDSRTNTVLFRFKTLNEAQEAFVEKLKNAICGRSERIDYSAGDFEARIVYDDSRLVLQICGSSNCAHDETYRPLNLWSEVSLP